MTMWSSFSVFLLFGLVCLCRLLPTADAAWITGLPTIIPSSRRTSSTTSSKSQLAVSIGLGPEEKKQLQDKDRLVAGVDYEIPNHEEHRLDRLSKLDEQCDAWFRNLLGENHHGNALKGPIADELYQKLTTVPELVNDIERTPDPNDEEWTPYVNTKLPWSVLRPAYGLEQFGLPTPRRNAETWRHFDVAGMVNTNVNGDKILQVPTTETDISKERLVESGASWLDDTECTARLVYVNGKFVGKLSKTTDTIRNVDEVADNLSDETILEFLKRLTDGWTEQLQCPVPMQFDAEPLTEFSKLSGPDHCLGKPSTQFAINSQQGTACFTALNGLKCENIALVQGYDGKDDSEDDDKPVLIIHAVDTTASDDDDMTSGAAVHPRTVIVAEENAHVNVVQQTISLSSSSATTKQIPLLYNGYTQVLLKDNANVTHCILEESGGMPVSGVEGMDDTVRAEESQRPAQQNTVLETLDVHCAGRESHYAGTVLSMGGNGRVRTATSITLLQPTASCTLNGFSLNGGTCRSDVKTNIHHIADGCQSQQLQKNMVAGRATTSFRGRIRVEQSAQQTDSQQLSRTVLLTDKSRAWAVPSLEIIADDVQCTHGATVSDLSEEELFYLRSRGLDVASARNLLMYAFCNDVMEHVPESIRGTLQAIDDNDDRSADSSSNKNKLQMRVLRRLENLVPTGKRAVEGEFQSI